MKALMDMARLRAGPARRPLVDVSAEGQMELREILEVWKLLP